MSAELALSALAFLTSSVTLGIVLVLLRRKQLDYASPGDVDKLRKYVTGEFGRLQHSQSTLYRYVEAVDEHTGAAGYRVLGKQMRPVNPKARKR